MIQKTINQNKLQTILCVMALSLGVLVSVVLFSMPPVHAATTVTEIPEGYNAYVISASMTKDKHKGFNNVDDFPRTYSENTLNYIPDGVYCIVSQKNDYNGQFIKDRPISVLFYSRSEFKMYHDSDGVITEYKSSYNSNSGYYWLYPYMKYTYGDVGQLDGSNANQEIVTDFSINHKVFRYSSDDEWKAYAESVLNGEISTKIDPVVPDTTDESYTYTGFSINGKTARWTGTTERSYLKDQEVEEYTRITYAWATTTEPDNIGTFQEYDGEFPTSAKQLKLPWSDMESGKTSFQFIRQVNITPCYRASGQAFYHGQAVKIFFKPDGTVDRVEQVTIPSDSETIGNDISLIGFRYDNSFHAEWVDVWSNGANKSAFDLSGSQYLSLGVRAVYYDGSKTDIDFFTLDRKDLTWNKTFSDFKENNGSPIKSLYFTPYAKTGVNNPWNKGNSTVINFDENGNPSSSFDTGDDGTVHLNDFKLTGVVWNKPVVQSGTITWTGTTPNSDLLFIPDSDTLVVATYPRYDSDMNTSYETWSTTTIGKGSMKVNVDYLIDYYKNSELAWNGEMWLTPCYKKGGVLYMGEPVIINCLKGTVSDIVVDEDSGKAEQVDKTEQNKSDADSILNVGNQFYSIINGLIGSLQQLPALLTAIFGFLPSSIINLLYASFAVIVICRILGR